MQRQEYTLEKGWEIFHYRNKEEYYKDFDSARDRLKRGNEKLLQPIQILRFFNQYDYSNQGFFKIYKNWGLYSNFRVNMLSRIYDINDFPAIAG